MYYFGYCTYLLDSELRKYLPEAVTVTKATAPNHQACASFESVKVPTMCGSTGTMRPMAIMSSSTVTMMKGIAAWRAGDAGTLWVTLTPCGSWALLW